MKCANCGADIPNDCLICPDCGTEVQIVPDYNPLEDVLAREVRGSVRDATRPIRTDEVRRYRERMNQQPGNSTRVISQAEMDDIRAGRARGTSKQTEVWRQPVSGQGVARRSTGNIRQGTGTMRQNTGNVRPNTGSMRQGTGDMRRVSLEERKRQQMLKKKRLKQKRMNVILSIVLLLVIVLGTGGYVVYQNSYDGVVRKGYQALQNEEFTAAEKLFQRAINKDSKKPAAYEGMAEIYMQQNKEDQAEDVFLKAIDSQPTNAKLYKAAIAYYVDTKQTDKISSLLDGCEGSVLAAVSEYVSIMPAFSLDEGTYPEVQEVTISGKGDIYYTTDDTEPTKESTKYEQPVLLNEGTTTIRAVAYNEQDIPSLIASKTYTIEIPMEDAPAVTPSTGQYTTDTQITIQVPEGYKAYYTMDGTTPSAASSEYTEPIDMPEGVTIFSAVLISDTGKMTQVTKRNYLLEYE